MSCLTSRLQSTSFKALSVASVLGGTSLIAGPALADITWNFSSTDGVNTLSGSLTTSGDPADASGIGNVFDLISIDSVSYNGVPISAWQGGSALPFVSTAPADQIQVVSDGTAELEPNTGNSLQAVSDDANFNFVVLARPGVGVESDALGADPDVAGFEPTSTSFEAVIPVEIKNITQDTSHDTLQDAINSAVAGDVVELGAGTISEWGFILNGRHITIRGQGRDQTIIDAGYNGRIFRLEGGDASTFESLTLRRGVPAGSNGGAAVNASHGVTAVFRSVDFRECDGSGFGSGAVNGSGSNIAMLFENCRFINNFGAGAESALGGALGVSRLVDCLFVGNSGAARTVGTAELFNCSFVDNSDDLAVSNGGTVVTNCVFDGTNPSGSVGGGATATRSLYPGATGNNVDGTPTFVDAANGDYRLAPGSLGIDAADYDAYITAGGGTTDLAGNWRRVDHAPANTGTGAFAYLDMGAYETSAIVNDCNTNGIEDSADLATIGAHSDFAGSGPAYTLNGTNPVVDNGSLRLTEINVQGALASAIYDPQLADTVANFRASFDAQFIYGSGFGADGISFALLDKQVHDTTALFGEMGPANDALVVRIREYIDQTVEIVYNGAVLNSITVPQDINDGQWHHFQIDFVGGVLTITLTPWGGQPIALVSVAPDFVPFHALYGFGARTGADTNEQRIDNVRFESLRSNDCDGNSVPDQCDEDLNGDSVPDACQCLGDLDNSGGVDVTDLLALLAGWGSPDTDVTGDGVTDVTDLLALLAAWGPCQ